MNLVSTSYSFNGLVSGEQCIIARGKRLQVSGRPVMYVHGAGEVATGWLGVAQRWPVIRALCASGRTIIATDIAGPQTWGNAAAQASMTAAYNAVMAGLGPESIKVDIVTQSMGFVNSVVWAKNNPGKVSRIVGLLPIVDLNWTYWNDSTIQTLVNEAHGGSWSEGANGAQTNPLTIVTNANIGVSMQLWCGDNDVLSPIARANLFASKRGDTVISIPGGHAENTLAGINTDTIINFLDA